MLLKKIYDEKAKTEKAWFDSTMFYYTEAVEYDDRNCVDLYVTFKNGATYKYKEVALSDYVLLIAGGTDASQGKTLNKLIKSKYEFERVGDKSIELLKEEYEKTTIPEDYRQKTYFISGHRDITDDEFERFYQTSINFAIDTTDDVRFVVGDYQGTDIKAQDYLVNVLQFDPEKICVYHMFDKPRNINPKIVNTVGGFKTDEERDAAMTNASFDDIAFVRNYTELSGTAQNILRRHHMS